VTTTTGERGSGTLVGLTVLAVIALLGSSAIVVTSGLNHARDLQAVANQAALAASDVSRGIVSGHPCRVASTLVTEAGFRLQGCDVGQGKAWIVVAGVWWGIDSEKRAHAGPPDHPAFHERK
jgi:hypothetical protein